MSSDSYILTVGLEIHAELKTRTKMFCGSRNDPDETRPNVNICPICMGHPGTLPTVNKEAVKHVLKIGLALGGKIADFTEFDRKNYFYPDIPKGYQLSQYEFPLVVGGELNGIAITRVHLEEDTATSIHESRIMNHESSNYSLLDFNRAGIPLMELVTEPVIHSAKEAADFARELQLLLRYLGVSDANMEKGEMRVEANISVAPISPRSPIAPFSKLGLDHSGGMVGRTPDETSSHGVLGTKVEVKNLNSFRAVERAIVYEMERHVAVLESGERVVQETRGWDETTGATFSQRRKEESHDYRYFPDPDLPKLAVREIPEFAPELLKKEIPELPATRRRRFATLGIKDGDAVTLVANRALGTLFEETAKLLFGPEERALAASYLTSDLLGLLKRGGVDADTAVFPCSPAAFAELVRMTAKKMLSSRGAKDILAFMFERGGNPKDIAKEHGLLQKSDAGELAAVVEAVIAAHRPVAEDYRGGKIAALQFLVGQAMKATRGAGNPAVLRELFISRLK